MKEQLDSLDERMRARVQDAIAPPPPHVWPAVEQALRKRRRRFIFWFALLGIFSAGAVGYLVYSRIPEPQEKPYIAPKSAGQALAKARDARSETPVAQTVKEGRLSTTAATPVPSDKNEPNNTGDIAPAASKIKEETKYAAISGQAAESPLAERAEPESDARAGTGAETIAEAAGKDIHLLPSEPIQLLAHSKRPLVRGPKAPIILPKKKKDQKSCYDFEEHPNVWFADGYAGIGLANRSLSTTDPEFLNYRRLRSETERSDLAYNAGLRASLLLNRHYLLRTGLHYDQLTEVFEYADPNFIEYTVKVRSELINGVWQTITDTVGVDYGEHYQKTYNRYGMLDIPVMLGGEWRSGRTGFNVQAGASINVLFWKKGSMLSAQGVPVQFDNSSATFRTRTGLSLIGSIQWFWHVQPRLRVFVEPYYRHILRPVTSDAYPISQQYGILGMQFGITKILD